MRSSPADRTRAMLGCPHRGDLMILVAGATGYLGSEICRRLRARGVQVRALVRAKREAEEHLRASGLTYTIIHPNLFMESWLGPIVGLDVAAGKSQIIGRGDNRLSYVAAADVAELAAQCVSSPAARNATIPIGRPEPMSH